MYYVHNLHFVTYARCMQGRKVDSMKAAENLLAALKPMSDAMPEMADPFVLIARFGQLRFGDWDAILQSPQPSQKLGKTFWHYSRALAHQAKSDHAAALREQSAFEEARKQVPADADWGQNKAGPVLTLASEILQARIGNDPVAHLRRAVEIQDGFTYDEPPAWYYPTRESLGAALLRAGQPAEAEVVFREGIRRSPKNGRMLFGLMESLRAQGKNEQAAWVQKEFEAAWSKADVKLTLAEL
jgi:hypothetical protein